MSCAEYKSNYTEQDDQTNNSTGQQLINFLNQQVAYYLLTCLCSLGILGNFLNLIVLTRKQLTGSMERLEKCAHMELVALAISDLFFCLVSLPVQFLIEVVYTSDDWLLPLYYHIYSQAFINIFLLCSTWITVLMAIERYLAVCRPFLARGLITQQWTRGAIITIFVLSAVVNAPRFWLNSVHTRACGNDCICYTPGLGALAVNPIFYSAYVLIWAIIGTFLPLAVLLTSNLQLLHALHQSHRMRQSFGATVSAASHRLTRILFAIVILFVLLVVPSEMVKFAEIYDPRFYLETAVYEVYQIAHVITDMLLTANFALNFLLYCAINSNFRRTLSALLSCKKSNHCKSLVKFTHTTMSQLDTEI